MNDDIKNVLAQRKESERKKRINQILSAARKLFLKKGYEQTTIRDICRESRLSNGAVFFYFKSKAEIYAHIYEECLRKLVDFINTQYSRNMSSKKRIETGLRTYVRFYQEHTQEMNILDISYQTLSISEQIISRFDQLIIEAFKPLHDAVGDYLEEQGLSKKFDPLELSILLVTSIDGLIYNHRQQFFKSILKDTPLSLERMVGTQIDIFLQALK